MNASKRLFQGGVSFWIYSLTNLQSPARHELAQVMSLENCYQNWVEFICSNEMIDPCVQTEGQTESQLLEQIKCFRAQERRSCMRIERRRFPSNMDEIVGAFTKSGAADYIIILEGGWAR